MEQIKPNPSGGANLKTRPVKDIIEPAKTVSSKVSVQAALDEMQVRGVDFSPVTDQRGELLGTVSKNEMNQKVGGMGHDPKTEPVEAQVKKNNAYCFEDQTVAEAQQIMLDAKVAEVPVVTREKLMVGITSLEALERLQGTKTVRGPATNGYPAFRDRFTQFSDPTGAPSQPK